MELMGGRSGIFGIAVNGPNTKTGKIMKKLSAVFIAALLGLSAYAAENAPAHPSEFAKAQAALKERAPEEYAKIEKLAATDLYAAMREFRALAQKHDVKLPRPGFGSRHRRGPGEGRGDFPGRGGDRPGRGDFPGRGSRSGRGGGMMEQIVAEGKMRAKFPEEYDAAVKELNAAEDKLQQLAERAEVKIPRNMISQLRRLREKAPEKFAEIERRAAEEPREAMRELFELAEANGIELDMPMMRGGRGGRPGRGGEAPEEKPEPRKISNPPIRKLREAFPEEMERYDALRQEDPAAAAKLLRELAEKLKERSAGDQR